jgi:putative transposase
MSQYRRAWVPGGTYFFTVVTYRRRPILTSDLARDCLRTAFSEVRARRPINIEAICLLPNHLHCVWSLPSGDDDYHTRWRQIKSLFTINYLRRGGREVAPNLNRMIKGERGIWQRRFYERVVRDEDDLKRCADYIHFNPVKHELVDRVIDWPWSSFHRYVDLNEYDADWGRSVKIIDKEWSRFE